MGVWADFADLVKSGIDVLGAGKRECLDDSKTADRISSRVVGSRRTTTEDDVYVLVTSSLHDGGHTCTVVKRKRMLNQYSVVQTRAAEFFFLAVAHLAK
jgi:hypothetical protein